MSKCVLDDLEVCERDIDVISTVTEDGGVGAYLETWYGEARIAYYHCRNCTESWGVLNGFTDPKEMWAKAKEHLDKEK